jgi:hypothetical protein
MLFLLTDAAIYRTAPVVSCGAVCSRYSQSIPETLFPTVEPDFAFYAMPKPENLAKMLVDGGPAYFFDKSLSGTDSPGRPAQVA